MTEMQPQALVVGAGPAGLMAAERLAAAGLSVLVAEAKPSAGRKVLMAGKSGLNLTKAEPLPDFVAAYPEGADWLAPMLAAFGPQAVQDWARDLGQPVFTGTSGRVFPEAMKASPLLRAWLARLAGQGVRLATRWRLTGLDGTAARFDTPEGARTVTPRVTVLALGGASWARLGSDGVWAGWLGGPLTPFRPSNVGLRVAWSPHMTPLFGSPVKGAALSAGAITTRGEFVVSRHGLEGSGIYSVIPAIRDGAPLLLDLFPDLDTAALVQRLTRPRGKASLGEHLRKTLRLDGVRRALALEMLRPLPADPDVLAALLKAVPLAHDGPRPMDEAISTAGGLPRARLTPELMLSDRPGVFAAGEMLDWDAPTGGYLLTACFATGRWAGDAAARYADATAR